MTTSFIYEKKNQNLKVPLLLYVVFDITEVPFVSDKCPFLKISTGLLSSAFKAVSNSLILASNWAIRVLCFFTVLCNSVKVCISDSDGRFSNIEMRSSCACTVFCSSSIFCNANSQSTLPPLSIFSAEARIWKFRMKNMLVHVEMDITDAIAMVKISDMTRTLSFFNFLTFVTFSAFDKD